MFYIDNLMCYNITYFFLGVNFMDLFSEENGFITFDKISNVISSDDVSVEEKLKLMSKVSSYNEVLCRKKKNLVNKLLSVSKECDEIANVELIFSDTVSKQCCTNNDFLSNNVNVSNYISLVNSFRTLEEFDDFSSIIDESEYVDVVNSLISYYVLEGVTLKKMIYESSEEVFVSEKEKIDFILSNLFRLRDNFSLKNDVSLNKIIYTRTDSNNVNFLSDLDRIPIEFYDNVLSCFNSILDGSFKNMKRIGKLDEGFSCALFQVRDNDIRIYYSVYDIDVYIVGGVLLKKVSISRDYSSYIRKISRDIKSCKEMLSNNSFDLSEYDEITKDVVNVLKLKKRGTIND